MVNFILFFIILFCLIILVLFIGLITFVVLKGTQKRKIIIGMFIGLKFILIITAILFTSFLMVDQKNTVSNDVIPIKSCKCNCTESELIELQRDLGISSDKACELCCYFHEIAN